MTATRGARGALSRVRTAHSVKASVNKRQTLLRVVCIMNERVFRSNARHLPPLPLPFFFELVRCFCELDLRGFLPLALPPPSLEYGDSPPELSPALDSAALAAECGWGIRAARRRPARSGS